MAHLCHGLAGANNGSLPHAVAHHGHRDTDEAGSSLHATVAPRHPKIRRPPRNLRAEAKPAAPTPPPPRPGAAAPCVPAPASTGSERGPDRALPGPVPAPPANEAPRRRPCRTSPRRPPPTPVQGPDRALQARIRPARKRLEHPPTSLGPWHRPARPPRPPNLPKMSGAAARAPCSAAGSPPSGRRAAPAGDPRARGRRARRRRLPDGLCPLAAPGGDEGSRRRSPFIQDSRPSIRRPTGSNVHERFFQAVWS
nr:uncharacterized protein LOC127315739 [Lolium perenne]